MCATPRAATLPYNFPASYSRGKWGPMNPAKHSWTAASGQRVSVLRLCGYGLLWLWTVLMFNSTVPYFYTPDPQSTLYVGLPLSLLTMVVTMLFVAIALRKRDRLADNPIIVFGAAIAMALGSLLIAFGDPAEARGMGLLMLGAILTGSGSACMFVCWGEQFFGEGGRLALIELSIGSCVAFIFGFFLTIFPPAFVLAIVALLPLGTALLLKRSRAMEAPHASEKPPAAAEPAETRTPLSRGTVALAVKASCGSLLVGVIAGFFNVMGGYNLFTVQSDYWMLLFLAGCMATLLLSLIAVFAARDSVFMSYRFAVLLICLGCLLTPFLGDNATYFSTLVFAGYTCFTIILYVLCIDMSTSFRINVARCLGLGFVAFYGGEVLGYLAGYGFSGQMTPYTLALITLLAVSLLFIAHLFLFTEVDLIKLGIGEVGADVAVTRDEGPAIEPPPVIDPTIAIAERYGLTPRERDVLPLLLEGRTIQRIQETLFISAGTVSTHIRHIYQKTGSDNRQDLIDLSQRLASAADEKNRQE